MKSIVYIVPYFGKFPDFFNIWLESCRYNKTVDWLIFTDDRTQFSYPSNVHVYYTTFDDIRSRIQGIFDFPITLHKPYKLCDYRPCYGAVFQEYINSYDYWGFCDIDLIWGDIRTFITDEVLEKYPKIGFSGHSTIIRNENFYNNLFRNEINGNSFKELITKEENGFSDEIFLNNLYIHLGIPFYDSVMFANLSSFVHNFYITHLPKGEASKNKKFIFCYDLGHIYRIAVVNNQLSKDEFMYVHFLKRKMDIHIDYKTSKYLIVPNKLIPFQNLTIGFIKKANNPHWLRFMAKHFCENAYKLNYKTIIPIFKAKLLGYYKIFSNNYKKEYRK